MDDSVSLMNKPVNDLTVKDALKLNGIIIAAMVVIPVGIAGVVAAKDLVAKKVQSRKDKKILKTFAESEK